MGGFTPGLHRLVPALTLAVAILLAAAISGCAAAAPDATRPSSPTPETATATPTVSTINEANEASSFPTLTHPAPTAQASEPEAPLILMNRALDSIQKGDLEPVRQMGASGEIHYIPVLVEFLRFGWRRTNPETLPRVQQALARLARQNFQSLDLEVGEARWDEWVAWLGKHPEVSPPEGFAGWKGRLFAEMVDPAMGAFLYDGVATNIRLEEVVWGGVPKDGIPDLTNPWVVTAEESDFILPEDRVFGVSINGEHRAYPHRILNAHEMANDVVGGVPFALAY